MPNKADAYKEQFEHIELFGKPALLIASRISRFTVPQGWFCYDLRGNDNDPGHPVTVENYVGVNHAGTVLTPTELKLRDGRKKIGESLKYSGETMTIKQFCEEHGLGYPADSRRFIPGPASPSEAGLFYTQSPEQEKLLGIIGHLRMDFGRDGSQFWTTWFPHENDELNTPEFKAEIDDVVNDLRRSVLKDRSSMRSFNSDFGGQIGENYGIRQFGYIIETEHYRYCLRCKPMEGDYDAYLLCSDKRAQEMAAHRFAYLFDTADYAVLVASLTVKELQLAEELVSDCYNGKYEVEIPRCEQADADGYRQIDFDRSFPLTAHDARYSDSQIAEELAVATFNWLEGFEDTGYFIGLLREHGEELANEWEAIHTETTVEEAQVEGVMRFG